MVFLSHKFAHFVHALRLFKALRLFFLIKFPGPMVIPCPTSIPDSRVFFSLQYCNIVQSFQRDIHWFCSNLITKFCFCSLCCIKFVLTFAPFIFTTDGMIPTKISVEEDDHHKDKSHLCFKILYNRQKHLLFRLEFSKNLYVQSCAY